MAGFFGKDRGSQLSNDLRPAAGPRRARHARGSGLGAARRHPAPAFPRLAGSGLESLEARLLMSAVRNVAGFTTGNLGLGDDRSTVSAQSLGFAAPIDFFGSQYNAVFVNNNGNVTFGSRNSSFVDAGLNAIAAKMIAPFYADVDTHLSGGTVRYGRGVVDGHRAFGVNWVDVDFYSGGHTNHNSFQLVLIEREDVAAGAFDIEFNYDQILWESGEGQNGGDPSGLGGNSARVGFTAGDGVNLYEMVGSGNAGSFLDTNPLTGLAAHSFKSDVAGRYVYHFQGGTWADAPAGGANTAPYVTLPAELVLAEGANGSTSIPADLTGIFDDPDADSWTVTADYGDNSGPVVLSAGDAKTFLLDHSYAQAGNYVVTVTVDDGNGGVGTASMPVGIYDLSAPVLEVSGPSAALEGDAVTLFASTDNDPDLNDVYSFDWVGDGVASEDGRSFTLHPTDNGTYTVRAIARDQWGNTSYVDVDVAVRNVSPTATGFTNSGPVDEAGNLTATLAGGDDASSADLAAGLVYSFDFDDDGVYEVSGASASADHVYADNGSYTVRGRVTDKDGGHSDYEMVVEVRNVAPTSSGLSAPAQADQGSSVTVTFGAGSDASGADLAAGLTYAFDFDGDGVYEVSGSSPSASHVYAEPGTHVVRGRVSDKDGGHSDYEASVLVLLVNRAPTATLVAPSTANEGAAVGFSLEGASDDAADLAAGLTYSFDLDGDGVYELSGSAASASRVFGDNGSYTVHARVTDQHGAHSDYSGTVLVANVAPVANLVAPATGNEGAALSFSLAGVSDPSAADAAAGFTYSFDFDNDGVYEVSGRSPAATHVFDDNGKYVVRARVTDKDGGSAAYTTEVRVKNVAPRSPRFWDNNPKAEGTVVTVGFDAVSDPSHADTDAGFTYSYDFNNDGVYEVTSTSPTATHTFGDNGVFWVRGRVTDKDGDFAEYTTDVEIYNVAPTAHLVVGGSAVEGSSMTFRLEGAADPSAADLAAGLTYSFDLDGDGVYETSGASPQARRSFPNEGSYTVRAKVTDKDGGSTAYSTLVQVANAAPVVTSLNSSASNFGSARQGSSVTVSGAFSDAGVLDRHTAVIDWGDGTTSAPALYEYNGTGLFLGSHVYTGGGIYTVSLKLKDNAAPAGTATGTTRAVVTGVGLHNGVLQVVGTNGADKVSIEDKQGSIKIKTDVLTQDPSFSTSSVKEVQVWLGSGADKFETKGTMTRPVYLNGTLYAAGQGGTASTKPGATKPTKGTLFSEILVAA